VTPTRPGMLVFVAVVCAAAAVLTVRATFATLPPLPWSAVPALLLLAVAETFAGRNLAARLRGRAGGKPLQPMAVARMAALAKASSLAAVVLGGLAAGFGIYVLGQLEKNTPRADAISALATVLAAAALLAAALYLERCCRSPRPPEDSEAEPGDRQGTPRW
jgi:Protein of unknown function (DUF3180)